MIYNYKYCKQLLKHFSQLAMIAALVYNIKALMSRDELQIKILILGESAVGKSSLLQQYIDKEFNTGLRATIGVEYKQKIMETEDGKKVKVMIWDTAGTARYNTLTPNYYRKVDGILLVYDITNQKSFEMINYWISQVNDKADVAEVDFMLVGNKTDLEEQRQVTRESGQKIAKDLDLIYVQTSAKTFKTTNIAFDQLVAKILKRRHKLNVEDQGGITLKSDPPTKPKQQSDCC